MHELGRYLQRKLDERGWTVSELIRRSGLSRQTVYNLINDGREHMDQTPQRKTVNGLADALNVSQTEILTVSAQALGVPAEALPQSESLSTASDEQILAELASRLSLAKARTDAPDVKEPQERANLRAVARPSDASQGQKTGAPDDIELELDKHGVTQLHGAEAEAFPKPPVELLAAHPPFETEREKFEREHGERGENSQDTDDF